MPRQPKPRTEWVVEVIGGAAPEEAEAAARQARRMVARWILRDTSPLRPGDPATGEEKAR
ncbi:MAG TPA: hypothetical protein VIL07_10120 [Symbiobacteriaceae bacterium]